MLRNCAFLVIFVAAVSLAENSTCDPSQIDCGNGRCIFKAWLCDGMDDCGNSADEIGCDRRNKTTTTEAPVCSGQFNCGNQRCINLAWVCDGDNDCGNYTDEMNCSSPCRPRQLDCGNGRCISRTMMCNGFDDCANNADENNCTTPSTSTSTTASSICPDNFDCGNGRCTPLSWVCDGDNDCQNYGDELNCSSPCQSSRQLDCGNGQCISRSLICDGTNDCNNNADETNCNNTTPEDGNFTSSIVPPTERSPYERAPDLCGQIFPDAINTTYAVTTCAINCFGTRPADGYNGRYNFTVKEADDTSCYSTYEDRIGQQYYRGDGVCFSGECVLQSDVKTCTEAVGDQMSDIKVANQCTLHCIDVDKEMHVVYLEESVRCYVEGTYDYGHCREGQCIFPGVGYTFPYEQPV